MQPTKLTWLAVAGLAFTSLACSTDSDRVSRTHTSAGDVTVTHDPDRYDDRGDVARENIPADVPRTAREVRTFSGRDVVRFRPDHGGMLFVTDQDTGRLIWSGRVDRGQQFELDPATNFVALDGQKLIDRPLNPDHRYRLSFDESRV